MQVSRYHSLSAALVLELTAGTVYGYGSYSEQLKVVLGGSQSAINLVGSVGQVGLYIGVFGGLVYDRFGAQAASVLGGLIATLGYALAYTATLGIGVPATTPALCLFFFLAWHGSGYLDTATISTSIKNFPQNKGTVLGLLKSLFGLSGTVVAQISVGVFGGAVSSGAEVHGSPILLFMAVWVAIAVALTAWLLRLDPIRLTPHARIDKLGWRRLSIGYFAVVLLSIYLSTVGVLRTCLSFSEPVKHGTTAAMGALLCLVALVGAPAGILCTTRAQPTPTPSSASSTIAIHVNNPSSHPTPLLSSRLLDEGSSPMARGVITASDGSSTMALRAGMTADSASDALAAAAALAASSNAAAASLYDDCPTSTALATVDFYLLWLAMFCGTGPGLMVLSNVAQIAQARAGAFTTSSHTACHSAAFYHALSSNFVVVCGVANCAGRLLAGVLSDRCAGRLSRPALLACFLLLMAASHMVLATIEGVVTLYPALFLCFLCYGGSWRQ